MTGRNVDYCEAIDIEVMSPTGEVTVWHVTVEMDPVFHATKKKKKKEEEP